MGQVAPTGSTTPLSPPYLQIATGQLNVRSGPGTSYDVIGKAPLNAYYNIVGGPQNGWYQIAYNGGTGWVSDSYVNVALDNSVCVKGLKQLREKH